MATGVFLWVVVAAIIGPRLVHVLANLSYYDSNPAEILAVWHGGLSSFGGLLGGVPTGLLLARRRCPELSTIRALDLVAPVLMASWGMGRLLGPQLMVNGGGHPSNQWFAMQYANGAGGYTPKELPVPIFQAIESFVIFAILIRIGRLAVGAERPTGIVIASAMALWGMERFVEQHLWAEHWRAGFASRPGRRTRHLRCRADHALRAVATSGSCRARRGWERSAGHRCLRPGRPRLLGPRCRVHVPPTSPSRDRRGLTVPGTPQVQRTASRSRIFTKAFAIARTCSLLGHGGDALAR